MYNRTAIVSIDEMRQTDNTDQRPIKRTNHIDDEISPIKMSSVKRRRIIVSSDEEDVEVEKKEEKSINTPNRNVSLTPKSLSRPMFGTPKSTSHPAFGTPKSMSRSICGTPKSSNATPRVRRPQISDNTTTFSTELAESFISSFRADQENLDDTLASVTTLDKSIYHLDDRKLKEEEKRAMAEEEKYMHEKLDWLKPEKIRDAQGRDKNNVDYDPTTLFVPSDFLKEQTPVGKFYELYHMDAIIAVECLSLAYMRGSYAHCGFPEAAYDQLVSRGFKVARVEQTETPQQLEERNSHTKGTKDKVVRRELCRITTCGTRTYGVLDGSDGGMVESSEGGAKFLLALKEEIEVVKGKSTYGICFVDTAVGKFFLGQFADDDCRSYLRTMLASHTPAQV
uniref:MutS_I domain-containing protein n=1 Tax=Heterorhabditis bacteriophora TaxID=37862 RepID=A0A1I7WVP2_HETBA